MLYNVHRSFRFHSNLCQSRDLTFVMEPKKDFQSECSCRFITVMSSLHQKTDTLPSINPPFLPKLRFLISFPPNPKSIRSAGPGSTSFQPRGWYGDAATFSSHESRSSTGKLGRTGGKGTVVAFLASGGERLNDKREGGIQRDGEGALRRRFGTLGSFLGGWRTTALHCD